MKNTILRIVEFAKTRPLIFGVGLLLLMPGFFISALFYVLGFIGWLRIFLVLPIVAGYIGYKYVRSEMNIYKDEISSMYRRVLPEKKTDKDDYWK